MNVHISPTIIGAMIAGEKIKDFAILIPFIFLLRSNDNKKAQGKRIKKANPKIINVFFNELKKGGLSAFLYNFLVLKNQFYQSLNNR